MIEADAAPRAEAPEEIIEAPIVTDFHREGSRYIASWTDEEIQIQLVFERVRVTDAKATAWIYAFGIEKGIAQSFMAPLTVAITDAAPRKRLIDHLAQRTRMSTSVWADRVEQAIDLTLSKIFEPEPLLNLAEVELDEDNAYLIDNMIPLGEFTVLLADQRSSKSYLLLYLMTCISLGIPSIFGTPNVSGPVIFYDTETTPAAHRRRLERIARGMGLPRLPDIHYRRLSGRLIDSERQIRAEVERLKPVLVGCDSLTYASGGNLNESESAGATVNLLGDLPTSTIATAHHGKQWRGAKLEDASVIGSALFEFKASARWILRKEFNDASRDNFNVLMRNLKMRDGAEQPDVVYNMRFQDYPRATTFTLGSTAQLGSLEKDLPAKERILKVLARAAGPMKTKEVAERLELSDSTVKRVLNELSDTGAVTNVNRSAGGAGNSGQWVLGATGKTVLNNRSPLDNSHQNGSGAPYGANRSEDPFAEPFSTVLPNGSADDDLDYGTDELEL